MLAESLLLLVLAGKPPRVCIGFDADRCDASYPATDYQAVCRAYKNGWKIEWKPKDEYMVESAIRICASAESTKQMEMDIEWLQVAARTLLDSSRARTQPKAEEIHIGGQSEHGLGTGDNWHGGKGRRKSKSKSRASSGAV
jgi:hypothetical protein